MTFDFGFWIALVGIFGLLLLMLFLAIGFFSQIRTVGAMAVLFILTTIVGIMIMSQDPKGANEFFNTAGRKTEGKLK